METNSELERHLGYWLRRVSNQVSGAFARALQARQVSVAEWVVLSRIAERPEVKPGELASNLGLTRGAISKILEKLDGKGWIARKTIEEDNRVQLISLTAPGKRVLPELSAIADRNDEHFFACLDSGEAVRLENLLRKLTDFHQMSEMPVE